MSDLQDIIARLKALSGPDRELDEAIVLEVPITKAFLQATKSGGFEVLHYTASIDAALTLVPENMWPRLQAYDNGRFGAHVWLSGPSAEFMSDVIVWGEAHLQPKISTKYTDATNLYALAICIAALKARSRTDAKGEK